MNIMREAPADVGAREALLDLALGADRRRKTCERLREGRLPAAGLSFVAREGGRLLGTVRLWSVAAGPGRPALLLGPLAVLPERQGEGIGAALLEAALARAAALGHRAVLLVGDPAYYRRFGFAAALAEGLRLPGPYEQPRLQGLELAPGALAGASGLVCAAGRRAPRLPVAASAALFRAA
jgi:predicted N-acetyltransferase YhbS